MIAPSKPPVAQTDGDPLPVPLPEMVGDRLVVEPVERPEKAVELFPWVALAWNAGLFEPIRGLLTPDIALSGLCW